VERDFILWVGYASKFGNNSNLPEQMSIGLDDCNTPTKSASGNSGDWRAIEGQEAAGLTGYYWYFRK